MESPSGDRLLPEPTPTPAPTPAREPVPEPVPAPEPLSSAEESARDLPRLLGLSLFILMSAGVFGFPVFAIVCWLYSLPWLAAMCLVLFFVSLGAVAALEYIRLQHWRYSMRQMFLGAAILFAIGNCCVALGYKQYQQTWAEQKPLKIANWAELSWAQKGQLAQALVDLRVEPTPAELLLWREQATFKERMIVRNGRYVREFAFAINIPKLLGQQSLIVRIDNLTQIPQFRIDLVSQSAWDEGED